MHNYLKAIEELSKSDNLHGGEITDFTREILIIASNTLGCNGCSAWLFEEDQSKLVSILSYNRCENLFINQTTLNIAQLPNYFKLLKKNEIIVANNARKEPLISELLDSYILPYKITSMIDVPLRSEGKIIGAICFEHVIFQHTWTNDEQKFTQSLAQLLSLSLETRKKREYQIELERIIRQKEILISEVNHRVKNNMSIIISLINLQKQKTKDPYHEGLYEEIKDKVYSISMIQEQLNDIGNIESINLGRYLKNLVTNLNTSYGQEKGIEINLEMEKVEVDISKAIPCGLIANEILTNSFKYAFDDQNKFPKLSIKLKQTDHTIELTFYDNGSGFDLNSPNSGMGLELIKDLSEQIDASIAFNTENGAVIKLLFPIS